MKERENKGENEREGERKKEKKEEKKQRKERVIMTNKLLIDNIFSSLCIMPL